MIQIAQATSGAFHNVKCGEVFCISPTVYNVTCCLCATKMHLDHFPSHFHMQHLSLAEESINMRELELKCKAELAKNANLLDNVMMKEEDPKDDPIKQELQDTIDDDKALRQLLKDKKKTRNKVEDEKQNPTVELHEFDIGEKMEVQIEIKKPNTRNSKKKNAVIASTFKEVSGIERKESEIASKISEDLKEEYDIDDDYTDKDWSLEDKISDTDVSETDDRSYVKSELPFPCHTCKRSYRTKRSLQKHNYSVHNPNKPPKKLKPEHKCAQCGEVFPTARSLSSHKWKHTGIFCDICGKSFTKPGNLMGHKIRHTGIKAHKCKECDKEFFTAKELAAHMICHTGRMRVICEICGKRCRDGGVLTAHMRRHTGERPAKCDVCGKRFFSFHDLNVHAVSHTSERPFKCDICGSTFQRKKALRVHKRIHSEDRKHLCKICGKGFAQTGGLNSHMRTHDAALEKPTNEPPQQTVASIISDSSGSHAEIQSALSTPACKTSNYTEVSMSPESSLLDQYMV